jgi:hypothetical protein
LPQDSIGRPLPFKPNAAKAPEEARKFAGTSVPSSEKGKGTNPYELIG